MKKLILLGALVCASQMYGMEPQSNWDLLPREVQVLVIQALNTGKDADATIRAIMAASRTSKALNQMINDVYYNNLKNFTALVDLLKKKFEETNPDMSRKEIAQKFNTSVAQEYVKLGEQLFQAIYERSPVKDVKELLEKGADPNYSGGQGYTILDQVHSMIVYGKTEGPQYENARAIFKLLLKVGAKPSADLLIPLEEEQVNRLNRWGINTPEANLRRELFDLLKPYAEK